MTWRSRFNIVHARQETGKKARHLPLCARLRAAQAGTHSCWGCSILIAICKGDTVRRALCFHGLVRVDERRSVKVDSLAATATLPHYSVLTASFHSHQVRCVHVCVCARDTMLVNVQRTTAAVTLLRAPAIASFCSLRVRNAWLVEREKNRNGAIHALATLEHTQRLQTRRLRRVVGVWTPVVRHRDVTELDARMRACYVGVYLQLEGSVCRLC